MSDTSLTRDGPANFRKLRVKKTGKEMTVNGWSNVPHEYEMGRRFINGKHEIINHSDMEKKMLQKMHEVDSKEKQNFHKKIEILYIHSKF